MHALDVMWVSFYSIGLLLASLLIISAVRKWVHNVLIIFQANCLCDVFYRHVVNGTRYSDVAKLSEGNT